MGVSVHVGVGDGCVPVHAFEGTRHMEVTDQAQVSILRNHLPCFLGQGLSLRPGIC